MNGIEYLVNSFNLMYLNCYATFFVLEEEEREFVVQLSIQTPYTCEFIAQLFLRNQKDKEETRKEVLRCMANNC